MSTVTGSAKRLLVGRALSSEQMGETLLPKRLALPVFCSDPLSSVAYATEPGFWTLTDNEAAGLRAYLQKGGFIIFDDIEGDPNPDYRNLVAQWRRAFPMAVPIKLAPAMNDASFEAFRKQLAEIALLQRFLLEDQQEKTPAEIAAALFISEGTARTYVSNILGKLGLASRTQAALYAVEHKLAEPRRA